MNGLSIIKRSDLNDEDESYVAISSICMESLVSMSKEERNYCDGLQQESDRQKVCAICLEGKPLLQLIKNAAAIPLHARNVSEKYILSIHLTNIIPSFHFNVSGQIVKDSYETSR